MSKLRVVLTFLLITLVTGCGNLQALKVAAPPGATQGRAMEIGDQPVTDLSIARNAFPIGNGTFISQSGGGSAVVGVMFGLVGAVVNSASVAAESDRIRNAVNPASVARIQPKMELAAAWKSLGMENPSGSKQVAKIEPFVIFYVDDRREHVYMVPGLRVTGFGLKTADGSSDWVGHYLFAIDETLSPQQLNEPLPPAELAESAKTVRAAYRELLKEVAIDLRSGATPKRKVATIQAAALKATGMGFSGYTAGDIDQELDGRLTIRVSMENYGLAMTRVNPYFVWVFPSAKQYSFDLGPEERQPSR